MKTKTSLILLVLVGFLTINAKAASSEMFTEPVKNHAVVKDSNSEQAPIRLVAHQALMKKLEIIEDKVPPEVMDEFKSTFVYDDEGFFIGARIDMLRPFLNSQEIMQLIEPLINGQDIAYEGYKPKSPRGCKKNNRWVCVLRDIDATH